MRKIVLVYGLIAGVIISGMFVLTLPFKDAISMDTAMVIGYSSMVAAFLLVFFGVRSYRDNVAGGALSFGRAFTVGASIVLVASTLYVATWQVLYSRYGEEYNARYEAHMIDKARASGASQAEIDREVAEIRRWSELYKNRLVNIAFTFLEPLPVGLIVALVSAGVLRRKTDAPGVGQAVAA